MKRYILYFATVSAIIALGACNAIKSGTTRIIGSSGASSASVTKKTSRDKASNTTKTANATKNQETPAAINDSDIAGEWVIVAVGATKITDREEMPYITFDKGRLYGSNGCNVINGSYRLDNGSLHFDHIATTMRYCPDVPFEHDINVVIADATHYPVKIEKSAQDSYLHLLSSGGKALLTAKRHNMGFLNGQWQVVDINGQAIDDEECNLFFDIAESKVHGNTGCNYFNGNIYINPDRTNALELSDMGVTRMACPKTAQETAMLVALEETVSAVATVDGLVALLDKNGEQIMMLKRSENNNSEE